MGLILLAFFTGYYINRRAGGNSVVVSGVIVGSGSSHDVDGSGAPDDRPQCG